MKEKSLKAMAAAEATVIDVHNAGSGGTFDGAADVDAPSTSEKKGGAKPCKMKDLNSSGVASAPNEASTAGGAKLAPDSRSLSLEAGKTSVKNSPA